jgi:hypothetical protein
MVVAILRSCTKNQIIIDKLENRTTTMSMPSIPKLQLTEKPDYFDKVMNQFPDELIHNQSLAKWFQTTEKKSIIHIHELAMKHLGHLPENISEVKKLYQDCKQSFKKDANLNNYSLFIYATKQTTQEYHNSIKHLLNRDARINGLGYYILKQIEYAAKLAM